MGLFNYAEAYFEAATALKKARLKKGHADSPVRFLYYHAIELYLKAVLRQHYSVETLAKKFGHDVKRMSEKAGDLGISLADEDCQIFDLIQGTDAIIEARYLRTGPKVWPTFDALHATCESVREEAAVLLRKNNVMVRL